MGTEQVEILCDVYFLSKLRSRAINRDWSIVILKRKCNVIDFAKLKETGLLTCAEDSLQVHSH